MALGGADWAVAWPAALCTDAPHASAAASLARPTRAGLGGWRALTVLLGVRLQACEGELALKLVLASSLEPVESAVELTTTCIEIVRHQYSADMLPPVHIYM